MSIIPEYLMSEVEEYFSASPYNIENPKIIIDIGSNIGAFAIRAHKEWPNALIYCYEPFHKNIVELERNLSSIPCKIEPFAVGRKTEGRRFYIGDMSVTGGFYKNERNTDDVILVPCISASLLPEAEVIKIDTEGAEIEILRSINLNSTQLLMVEYHSEVDRKEMESILESQFYKILHNENTVSVGTMVFRRK